MATKSGRIGRQRRPVRRIVWAVVALVLVGLSVAFPRHAAMTARIGQVIATELWAGRGNLAVAVNDQALPRAPVDAIPAGTEGDAAFFKYGAIGNEGADGLPLKLWAVLPDVCSELMPKGRGTGYRAFGFTYEPDPATGKDRTTPVGLSRTRLGLPPLETEVVAITCAACHVQTYRLPGESETRIFVGGANNRLDALAYTRFLGACADSPEMEPAKVVDVIQKRFPQTGWLERQALRFAILPVVRDQMRARLGMRFHWTWSRPDWGPGRLSPFNPVKFDYLEQPVDETIDHADVMPAWNVTEKQRLRSPTPWHWDGLSSDLREVIVNSALGDGVTQYGYRDATIDRIKRYLEALKSPKAPFPIDAEAAGRGRALFAERCAACHGRDGSRVMTIIPRAEIGTDPGRIDMWTPSAAAAYNAYDRDGKNPKFPWVFSQFQKNDGYLAQPLDGIWLTGPYLHNGSVPTLDDLLKPPAERPRAFLRGLDEIDTVRGGYRAPTCNPVAVAMADGWCFDTARPGNSNAGHTYGSDLTDEERKALVAYLLSL